MTEDPLQALTGDAGAATLLRQSLTQLAADADGTALGYRVSEVLAGERDVRDLGDDPEFAELTRRGMLAFTAEWEALSPQEQAEQRAAGEAYLAGLEER